MRHATGLANVSGLRSTCTAFCSVQAAVSETDESEQIKIRAVSILFPLAFFGRGRSKGRKDAAPTVRKQELRQLAGLGEKLDAESNRQKRCCTADTAESAERTTASGMCAINDPNHTLAHLRRYGRGCARLQ